MTLFPYGLESNVFGMSGMRKYFVTLVIQKYTVDAVGSSQIFFPTQNLEKA